ncbi:MAG TPA: universal stress protein [Alphaproteobacteria bacterium]|nr:universal stress protein [Alphaproteobacteria bacterium]
MTIRSILALVTGHEADRLSLASSMRLAQKLNAFIDVLHITPDPREALPFPFQDWTGAFVQEIKKQAEKKAEALTTQARWLFEEACTETGINRPDARARFQAVVGRISDIVALRGRVFDLVSLGRASGAGQTDWQGLLKAALMESGRPLLILPVEPRGPIGRTVALAWNGSAEAGRATSSALPILAGAQRILLLVGTEGKPVSPPPAEVERWLERHGISSRCEVVFLRDSPVGTQLVREAEDAGADLLVMGAYGHSRLRETVFGGATEAVLQKSTLPVLMAH